MTYYTIIQKGYTVLATGTSKEETLRDLCEWTDYTIEDLDTLEYSEYYCSAQDGDLVLIECTEAFYAKVQKYGSQLYDITDNTADLLNS